MRLRWQVRRIAAIAQQANPLAGFHQRDQFAELRLRGRALDVLVENPPQRVVVAGARRLAPFRRRAELLQSADNLHPAC